MNIINQTHSRLVNLPLVEVAHGIGKCLVALLALCSMFLVSCKENDDTVEEFANWQETNDAYVSNLYSRAVMNAEPTEGKITAIKKWSYNADDKQHNNPSDYIYVEVLSKGDGTVSPIFTDSVRVHYQGRLLPSASYTNGYVFDQSWTGEYDTQTNVPVKFAVGPVVDGFTTALQHMHKGDRWKVYIPYQLGYGESGNTSIPGYSTLVFDITLSNFWHVGEKVPDFH